MPPILKDIEQRVQKAVAHYWTTLGRQGSAQKKGLDTGTRARVTGGKQMNGFAALVADIIEENGLSRAHIHVDKTLELPGFFRATKKWDLVVVRDHQLIAAIELKSQAGPSFGNNFNNRAEEAIGTAKDLWTAYEKGAFGRNHAPWLGWGMLLEDCEGSRSPVDVEEPHFKVFPEFRNASYAVRYELMLRRLVLERLYTRAALLLSTEKEGLQGKFSEPAKDLCIHDLFVSLAGHIGTIAASRS
jgi:hypothetical protein